MLYDLICYERWGSDTLILGDGLLRLTIFVQDQFVRVYGLMKVAIERTRRERERSVFLVGLAKQSRVIERYRLAMAAEDVSRPASRTTRRSRWSFRSRSMTGPSTPGHPKMTWRTGKAQDQHGSHVPGAVRQPARTCRDDAHDRIRADIGLILARWAWIPHRNYPILTQPGVPGTASVDFGQ